MRDLLGGSYKWLVDTIHKISNTQAAVNASLFVSGLTVRSNTPTGGNIAWSACTVWYQGTPYPISAGNTAAAEMFVYWTVGATAFSMGNSYVPGPTTFAILTNNQGTVDTAWDKVAVNSVQASQVVGNLLPPGYQVQPPATINLTGAGTFTLLSYTGSGGLISLGFNLATFGSFTNISFTVNVDGQGAQTYPIYTAGTADNGWTGSSIGGTAPASIQIAPFNISFKISIVVQVVVTGVGITGTARATASYAQLIA
jgi:hypothetical protein